MGGRAALPSCERRGRLSYLSPLVSSGEQPEQVQAQPLENQHRHRLGQADLRRHLLLLEVQHQWLMGILWRETPKGHGHPGREQQQGPGAQKHSLGYVWPVAGPYMNHEEHASPGGVGVGNWVKTSKNGLPAGQA